MSDRDRIDSTLFGRLCEIIDRQKVSEWCGGIHPEDVGHLARALIDAGARIPDPPTGCGGCKGLGAHRPTCITQPGWLWRKAARMAEDLGDLIGAHDTELANRAYQLAGDIRRAGE